MSERMELELELERRYEAKRKEIQANDSLSWEKKMLSIRREWTKHTERMRRLEEGKE